MKLLKLVVGSILIFFLVTYISTAIANGNKVVDGQDISLASEVYNIPNDESVQIIANEPSKISQQEGNLKQIVMPFYTKCLTVNRDTNVAELMGKLLADNFQSTGSVDTKTKAQVIKQVEFFWKLIPNLKWEVQEMLQDGNRVIVRSIASGTPKGDFMGLATDGTKSFKIMTTDIHTVKNGQLVQAYHVEDWATAIRQLRK